MQVPILRARSVGELLDAAFQVVRARFVELTLATLVILAPTLVLRVLLPPTSRLALVAVAMFLQNYATAAAVVIVGNAYLGRPRGVGEVFRRLLARFWAISAVGFIRSFLIVVGLVLFVAPGVIFSITSFAAPVAVMQESTGINQAFDRSTALTQGYGWHVMAVRAVAWVLLYITTYSIGFVLGKVLPRDVAILSGATVDVLFSAFPAVVATLLYYDLRIRKEGFDVQMLLDAMGPAPADEQPVPAH